MTTASEAELKTSQVICQDLPMESEEHYWASVHSPKSIPMDYRECMTCYRIDASEAITAHDAALEKKVMSAIDNEYLDTNKVHVNNYTSWWEAVNGSLYTLEDKITSIFNGGDK